MQGRHTGQWVLVLVVVTALLVWPGAVAARDAQPFRADDLDACPFPGCAEPGINAQIAHADTFHRDRHPDLMADYMLANPPFNDSDWRGELLKDNMRWGYGVPPVAQMSAGIDDHGMRDVLA